MKEIIAFITIPTAAMLTAADLPADTKAKPAMVKIDNFSFTPQTLTVRVGTKVTWINQDDVPHTVRSNEKTLKSGVLDTDDQFAYTFTTPGTNSYYCSVHPHMTGKVIVR
jgi:plastocyanin